MAAGHASGRLACVGMGILILVIMNIGGVRSDLAEDEKSCTNQLLSLTPCLPYVSERSKSPTLQCCNKLRNQYNQTEKCLCILVRDRNEPGLGYKINATLAFSIPLVCHIPANPSDCIGLLHLAPNSSDAQMFLQYAYLATTNATLTDDSSRSSGAWRGSRWLGFGGVSIWIVISVFITAA